jgi:hypothetical protein
MPMFNTLPKRATRDNADRFIRVRADFKTGGALKGYARRSDMVASTGYLPQKHHESFYRSTYRVYSYSTPIAWWSEQEGWVIPDVKYSITTTRHQSKARVGAREYREN